MSVMPRGVTAMLLLVVMPAVNACSRPSATSETTRKAQVAACAREGDRCEFAPGKIGLCTASTAKERTSALACVSLH